jgi:hypothetical protein
MKTKKGFKKCPFCGELPRSADWCFIYLKEKDVVCWSHYCEEKNAATYNCVSLYGKSKEEIREVWNGRAIDKKKRSR